MDLSSIIDFANQADDEIGKFRIAMILSPEKLSFDAYSVKNLNWKSIKYGATEIDQVPSDKRGIYAFSISQPSHVLPPHGHILYIGIAGRKSNRSLKARYRDYLNPRVVVKRSRIAKMIGTWHKVLRFHFAPVEDTMTSKELEKLEKHLNSALLPPFSEGDLEADTKMKRRAFK